MSVDMSQPNITMLVSPKFKGKDEERQKGFNQREQVPGDIFLSWETKRRQTFNQRPSLVTIWMAFALPPVHLDQPSDLGRSPRLPKKSVYNNWNATCATMLRFRAGARQWEPEGVMIVR
jgi:hypothetical protein